MSQRAARPGGYSTRSGRKAVRAQDDLPTAKELRELSARLGGNCRRSRCGRPGRVESSEYWQRVEEKLRAAAKAGRGLHFLSRDELDALLVKLAKPAPVSRRRDKRAHKSALSWGIMP